MSHQRITLELTVAEALTLSHAAETIKDDAAEAPDTFGWDGRQHSAYLRAIEKLNTAIARAGGAGMSEHKEAAVLPMTAFYDRVAWLQFHGAYQEANALREMAPLFEPPITVDEGRIERRVAMFISDAMLRPSDLRIGD